MAHKCVVRNQSYQVASFNTVERHNERKNDEYFNGDVLLERSQMNVHFKRCYKDDGTPETYHETFNRLLDEKIIVKHGTKPDGSTKQPENKKQLKQNVIKLLKNWQLRKNSNRQ